MTILETKGLTKRFGNLTAVNELTISVEAAEAFGLLGADGAGKTTTIKILTTLLRPTSGQAQVAGFDIVSRAPDVRRAIGYVPQAVSVDGTLTAYENLLIFAKLYEIVHPEQKRRVREALAFMALTDTADKLVREYSGGMIRRLEIAQSTLHRPVVLFLDEPTVGLDPLARKTVWDHLHQLRATYGTTVFFTTHYMDEAESHCTRLAIMHQGRLAALGTPVELKASVGGNGKTLDDVFAHYAGSALESGGTYREVSNERQTARRLA
ncbi:MAG: ATP-binding cassette domain-containing protein [Limisphaerales bacterium]